MNAPPHMLGQGLLPPPGPFGRALPLQTGAGFPLGSMPTFAAGPLAVDPPPAGPLPGPLLPRPMMPSRMPRAPMTPPLAKVAAPPLLPAPVAQSVTDESNLGEDVMGQTPLTADSVTLTTADYFESLGPETPLPAAAEVEVEVPQLTVPREEELQSSAARLSAARAILEEASKLLNVRDDPEGTKPQSGSALAAAGKSSLGMDKENSSQRPRQEKAAATSQGGRGTMAHPAMEEASVDPYTLVEWQPPERPEAIPRVHSRSRSRSPRYETTRRRRRGPVSVDLADVEGNFVVVEDPEDDPQDVVIITEGIVRAPSLPERRLTAVKSASNVRPWMAQPVTCNGAPLLARRPHRKSAPPPPPRSLAQLALPPPASRKAELAAGGIRAAQAGAMAGPAECPPTGPECVAPRPEPAIAGAAPPRPTADPYHKASAPASLLVPDTQLQSPPKLLNPQPGAPPRRLIRQLLDECRESVEQGARREEAGGIPSPQNPYVKSWSGVASCA